MFRALTALARRHHRPVLVVAALLTVLGGLAAGDIQRHLSSTVADYTDMHGQSIQARDQIQRQTGIDVQQGYVLLIRTDRPIDVAAAPPDAVTRAEALLHRRGEVRRIVDYRSSPAMIGRDRHHTYVVARVGRVVEADVTPSLEKAIAADPVLRDHVTLGGPTVATEQISAISTSDLSRAESLALPILFVLLFFVFRGVVAAALPLLGGIFSIVISLLVLRVLSTFSEVSVFALNLVIALGLGLAIDFSLLITSRYREELAGGGEHAAALRRTLTTTGRTVLFSALTVSAALATLTVFPIRFISSMGIAGMLVVGAAALYGLVVLPAVLALLGRRVNALAPGRWRRRLEGGSGSGRWDRWAMTVMRRPAVFAVVSAAVLLVFGAPSLAARFTGVDVTALPSTSSAAVVDHALRNDFPGAATTPFQVAVQAGPGAGADVASYARGLDGVAGVTLAESPRYLGGSLWEIDGTTPGTALSSSSLHTVQAVRDVPASHPARVTGWSASFLDEEHAITAHIPPAAGLAVATTLVVLFFMTGSVLLPIKALIMNVLTLSAATGALVWLFQQGHGEALLGFTSAGALDTSTPLVMIAVAFGLSTDYGVFLLGRITEEHERGAATRPAVAMGLERTGRIVTSAAILLCIATGALVLSRLTMIKELGIGITFAVLVDASIVRAVLVPSLMAILGDANWWAPAPLRRLRSLLVRSPLDIA